MSTLSTAVRVDPVARRNAELEDWSERFARRDNAAFLAAVASALGRLAQRDEGIAGDGLLCIGLLGEFGHLGYGLRRAQAAVRLDRQPSYWSHAFLVATPLAAAADGYRRARTAPWLLEAALVPHPAMAMVAFRSGASPRPASDYLEARFRPFLPHVVPNLAILAISLTAAERAAVRARAIRPHSDPTRYDLSALRARWLAYLADPVVQPNPLAEGIAVPGAAYVQFAYDAAGVDLAPGAMQRNICPEHVWQFARRLYRASEMTLPDGRRAPRRMVGWYCVRDRTALPAPDGQDVAPERLDQCIERARGRQPPRRAR
ncbi:MAG TPA: hypothetical protein VFU46_13520 [Gemmatimonadales bacterium]|nr:hypothetical protein [Gemmatimonadales bacterium]